MTKLTFLGDIMCKSEMICNYKNNENYNFDGIFKRVKGYLEKSDFVFGNLETPISINNENLTNEKYCFSSPYEFAHSVYNSGIKFVATANNHCLDRGISGIDSTVKSLDKIGFYHTGIFSSKNKSPLIINVNSLKLGMLAYTYGTNAFSNKQYLSKNDRYKVNLFQNQELSNPIDRFCYYNRSNLFARIYNKLVYILFPDQFRRPIYEHKEFNWHCKKQLKKDIKTLKDADVIIMYMHAGGQYNETPTKYTKKLSKWLVDNGVDLVVGSHEHVVHGGNFKDINKGKAITYSLGNFDGISGVYEDPFDKMSEYSIAWNVYYNDENKCIEKSTFSIFKTIKDGKNKIQVVPCFDLLKELDAFERKKLIDDMSIIAYKFIGYQVEKSVLENQCEIVLYSHGK